jgi:hypothetical protein
MGSKKTKRWPKDALKLIAETPWDEDGGLLVAYTTAALKGLLACSKRPWADVGFYLADLASEIAEEVIEEVSNDATPEDATDVLESTTLAVLEGVCAHPDSINKRPDEIVATVIEQTKDAIVVMAQVICNDEDEDDEDEDEDE